jgi:hypothetical protein
MNKGIPLGVACLLSLAGTGCSSSPDTATADQPKAASKAASPAKKTDSAGAPTTQELKALISPEIEQVFRQFDSATDQSEATFSGAMAALEAEAPRHARALRELLNKAPANAHGLRERIVYTLGQIGADDDARALEKLAITPQAPGNGQPTTPDQREGEVLRRNALFSLVQIAKRGNSGAHETLDHLLAHGDQEIATLAAVELHSRGLMSDSHASVLKARNIKTSFERVAPEYLNLSTNSALPGSNKAGNPVLTPPKASK